MRIAICLSGQPRTWRATRKSLADFFAGHDLDIFIHTWREGDPAELQALQEAYAPRAARLEERPLFVAEKRLLTERYPTAPPLPLFDMFYSVAGSLNLVAESGETYDIVVRARFDSLFDGAWSGEVPPPRALIIPDLYPYSSGCTDQFALGAPADMATYGAIDPWLRAGDYPQYAEHWLQPERILRHYLEQVRGLKVEIRPMAVKLLRDAYVGLPFAQVSDDPVFHAAKHEAWEAFAVEQFPEVAAQANFQHVGRLALELERSLDAWLAARPRKAAFQLLKAPWPARIASVDAFIAEQAGPLESLDDGSYRGVRLICAMLLQRMAGDEPMNLESFVVHALSANAADMQRAHDWVAVDARKLEKLQALVSRLGPLTRALTFANPLEQPPIGAWRPR